MDLCCFATQLADLAAEHDKLAGWAQFVGSLLGLAAAFWLGGAPARHEARVAAARREDFFRTIGEAANFAMASYGRLVEATEQGDDVVRILELDALKQVETSKLLRKALREPLANWPSAALFITVQNFVFTTGQLHRLAGDMVMGRVVSTSEAWRESGILTEARLGAVREAKAAIDAELARLRAAN